MLNFPHCIRAIDGKHIAIQAPAISGSYYFNYKGGHSVVLLAVADAQYRFILVDIGDAGRHSDGGVLANSEFGQSLEKGDLNIPPDQSMTGTTGPNLPFIVVGDEAFQLRTNMLRPFNGRNLPDTKAVFNYRLSRARRIIENSFGILAASTLAVILVSFSCKDYSVVNADVLYGWMFHCSYTLIVIS